MYAIHLLASSDSISGGCAAFDILRPITYTSAALPLLLVLLSAIAWGLPPTPARYTAIVVLNFVLIYTGFGLFMGLITPLLLAIDIYDQARDGRAYAWAPPLIALGLAFASLYTFSVGYVFQPAIECFHFPHQRPWEYPWFAGLMFARFLGVGCQAAAALASILGCALLILMANVTSELKESSSAIVQPIS